MNRTISTEETNQLFEFCHRHFVYHYDLQVELVDHLASSMEEQWETQPELSFEEALKNTFKKFGIHGFSKIKEQKQKELTRKYNRLIWKYVLEFFSWPKIVMTAAFTLVLATIFKIVENDVWVLVPVFAGLTLFMLYYYFLIFPKKFKSAKVNGKKFLLLEQLKRGQQISFLAMQLAIQTPNLSRIFSFHALQNNASIFGVSLFIVLLTIMIIGEMFYVPNKIKEHFREQFPEFVWSNVTFPNKNQLTVKNEFEIQ